MPPGPAEIDVWFTPFEAISSELWARYEALLTPEERQRRDRFRVSPARELYWLARAVSRTLLGAYTATPPARVEFTVGPHGKPELATASGSPPIRFNLSHADGIVVCAVTRGRRIGVDVEPARRIPDWAQLAGRVCSPAERSALWSAPEPERAARFMSHWTLKEAYIKARGEGLSLPLQQVEFDLGAPLTARFGAALADEPDRWSFELCPVHQRFLVATAVERGDEAEPKRVFRQFVPLETPPFV